MLWLSWPGPRRVFALAESNTYLCSIVSLANGPPGRREWCVDLGSRAEREQRDIIPTYGLTTRSCISGIECALIG